MISTTMNESDNNSSFISQQQNLTVTKKRRILVLGAPGVGKSAVIVRFKDDIFRTEYLPTIQQTYKKELRFNNEKVEMEINDLDGQNEFTLFSFSKFAFGVHGYILCYSIENQHSFNMVRVIQSKLATLVGADTPKVLIANKTDLNMRRAISVEQGRELAKSMNCPYLECSARSGVNIPLVFHSMLVEINKYESHIDFNRLSCIGLIHCFIRNERLLVLVFYILVVLQMVKNDINYFSYLILFS